MKAMLLGAVLALGMFTQAWAGKPHGLTELQVRARVSAHASDLLERQRWAEIDAYADDTARRSMRTPSGLWVTGLFFDGLEKTVLEVEPTTEAGWDALEQRTLAWAKAQPQSAVARVMVAEVLIHRAWSVRGDGCACDVPAAAWKPFRAHLARAHAYLVAEKTVASRSPLYYDTLTTLARAEESDRATLDRVLAESEQRFPGFYPAYFGAMSYLLPQWHGSEADLEAFARQSVERTRAKEGQSMYARIYWFAAQSQYADNLFFQSDARWSRMKAGFDDVVKRYPDQWNLQNYAHFACEAEDMPTYKAVMARVQGAPIASAWEGRAGYAECQRWAGRVEA